MLEITQMLIPSPSKRRAGIKIAGVSFLVAHDTGNDGSTALQNATYFINSANDIEASSHYFVDDKQIICCVPETEKAWHVRYCSAIDNQIFGKDANDWAIGIELCYDPNNIKVNNLKAYENYVEFIASLCRKYNLSPHKHIVGHYTLDPTRRTDPINAFKYINKTWDNFLDDVEKALILLTPPASVPTTDRLPQFLSELMALIKKYQ